MPLKSKIKTLRFRFSKTESPEFGTCLVGFYIIKKNNEVIDYDRHKSEE